MKSTIIIAWVVAILAMAGSAHATEPMPLPDFEVVALDGGSVRSQELASNGKWLLIYVQPNCRPCEALLTLVTEPEFSLLARKLVIIVGGATPDEAGSMASRFPDLAAASWYSDPPKTAQAQMKIGGAPVAIGVLQTNIIWNLSGVLSESVRMKSILKSWIDP
jgi:hypothetical protein